MGMSIESLVHSNSTSPVMGNANAGEGWKERKVVKRKPPIDVYFTAPLMGDAVWSHDNGTVRRRMVGLVAFPNGCIREAEYQETIGRFSDLYRRRFGTF